MDVLGGFEENYSSKIKKYEEEGWLHYQGYQDDVRPFIEKCHCFVLPSWHEGIGKYKFGNVQQAEDQLLHPIFMAVLKQ